MNTATTIGYKYLDLEELIKTDEHSVQEKYKQIIYNIVDNDQGLINDIEYLRTCCIYKDVHESPEYDTIRFKLAFDMILLYFDRYETEEDSEEVTTEDYIEYYIETYIESEFNHLLRFRHIFHINDNCDSPGDKQLYKYRKPFLYDAIFDYVCHIYNGSLYYS